MDHADTALYQAKDNGRGCFAYFSGNELTLL
jgi:GGDEF domain-containing protein